MKEKSIIAVCVTILALGIGYEAYRHYCYQQEQPIVLNLDRKTKVGNFWVVDLPTPNIGEGNNEVQGVILHHTASETLYNALSWLCNPEKEVSSHAVIDKDGTRYILAKPNQITWHAGYSVLNGRDKCNNFTIGIEFHGNTLEEPLTEEQVNSAIDYLLPIIKKYGIKRENIVTHEFVRNEWNKKYPQNQQIKKEDITPAEFAHFMKVFDERAK